MWLRRWHLNKTRASIQTTCNLLPWEANRHSVQLNKTFAEPTGHTLRSNYVWIRSPQLCVYRGHNLVKYSKEVSKKCLKQCYQGNNTSSKRRASAQRQGLLILTRPSKWWQRKEEMSTYGTPLVTQKLKFEDSERVCVAKTSCKAQLEKHTSEGLSCACAACHLHTPVSRTCALSCFSSSNYVSHSAIYTLQSGSIGDQGHTFVKQLDKGKNAKTCNKKKKIPLFKAKASKNRTFVLMYITNSVTANIIPSVTSV